jgi:putative CocE/NonD family hydrolase
VEPFVREADDGYDTVEWAARLNGSNGRVGMFGLSYWGSTQWQAAIAQPPSLGAIAPGMTWADPDDGLLRRGGARQFATAVAWGLEQGIDHVRRSQEPPPRIEQRVRAIIGALDELAETGLWRLPASVPSLLKPHDVPGLEDGIGTAASCRVVGHHNRVRVPVFGIGGWHDAFIQGALDNHTSMTALDGDSRIVIGPWSHANFSDTVGGQAYGVRARKDGGPAGGADDVSALQLAWFRRHLTDDPVAEDPEPRVRIFVMGANRWRETSSWPPAAAAPQRWYLGAGGSLSPAPPAALGPDSEFVYDPADPVPSAGAGASLSTPAPHGPADQAPVEARPDVLVFTSPPLPRDLEVAGRVRVALYAESSAPSTDWVARVCDVHPDGTSYGVCDGILRVAGDASEPRRHEIDLWSTCIVLGRGHRLRVQVTSSSFPRWDRNLNTGDQAAARHVPAHQRVHHDLERHSWLELSVV